MLVALLLCALVASVASQGAKLTIATLPTIGTLPTVSPDICYRPVLALTATTQERQEDDVADGLNSGKISVDTARAGIIHPPFPPRLLCQNGPRRVIHSVPNEFHWPPIFKGSCNNLPGCKVPPCFPLRTVWRQRCVLVFKWINGRWVKVGFRIRRYLDHLSCECKKCKHITSRAECVKTYPCPNVDNTCSFCFWTPHFIIGRQAEAEVDAVATSDVSILPIPIPLGRCACCEPTCCDAPKRLNYDNCRCECPNRIRCPPGQMFSEKTCKCECPKGSVMTAGGKCIGNCDVIDPAWCPGVICRDNPHFKCRVSNYKCTCPSCEGADPLWCPRTKCLEQPAKPKCVKDSYTNRCRCPQCSDQKDALWCRMTTCSNNLTPCRWEAPWKKCLCPH